MKEKETQELTEKIDQLKTTLRLEQDLHRALAGTVSPELKEFSKVVSETFNRMTTKGQLAEAERQLALTQKVPEPPRMAAPTVQSSHTSPPAQPPAQRKVPTIIGPSADGRTYLTPQGPVALTARGAEVIEILVAEWKQGVTNVSIEFIKRSIAGDGHEGDTRIRDYVGKAVYPLLIEPGPKKNGKGTVRLIHPPQNPQ